MRWAVICGRSIVQFPVFSASLDNAQDRDAGTRMNAACTMRMRGWGWGALRLLLLVPLLLCPRAQADLTSGPLSLSGNLQTQQILRHPELEKWSMIQQRNVV